MRRKRWLLVLVPLLCAVTLLGWSLAAVLLNWLTPWFAMPAPALTRGELGLILLLLVIVSANWRGRP